MLDINKLYSQIQSLSSYQQKRSLDMQAAIKTASRQLQTAAADTDALRSKIERSNTSSLVALVTNENPAAVHNPPPCPESYTILSTDGSQIEPSRHNSHPAFLINVGEISIGYNAYHGYTFNNEPRLFFEDSETLRLFGGEERPVAGTVLAALRQKMEAETLSMMIETCANKPAVALVDGTLILWTLEQRADRLASLSTTDLKLQSFQSFMSLLNTGRIAGVPVAGYISSPAGSDVINMLKVSLCPCDPVDCRNCPYKRSGFEETRPCATIDGITDSSLFGNILADGQRSSLFESRSEILDAYKKLNAYGNESVFFFYLNTGAEIARIEIPRWVAGVMADANFANNAADTGSLGSANRPVYTQTPGNTGTIDSQSALGLTHAICLDQAEKGIGYPIAIAEAHEQAVVKGPDRELFHQLVERALIQRGAPIKESVKALRKRGGLL